MDSKQSGPVRGVVGAVIAVGLVLAALIYAGLVLNLVTGFTTASWAVAVGVLAVPAAAAIVWRARRHAPVPPPDLKLALPAAGYLLLALGLATGAVVLAAHSAGWQQQAGFAQLWLVPAKGSATLGVRNHYPDAETFRLVLHRGSATAGDWQLRLAAGQSWQRVIAAPAGTRLAAWLISPSRTLSVTVTP